MKHFNFMSALMAFMAATPLAAQNRIDGQSANAPELAAYGPLAVGVRQIDLVNPDQVDILAIDRALPRPPILPTYDRPLTVELWYPAAAGSTGETTLSTILRDGITPIELEGRGIRDAAPAASTSPAPLVLLSHGYPGNRFLMSHLAENLASKGYVVASIDHTESTYSDQAAFGSTLVNRTLDQLFVLNEMARISNDITSPFAGLIDTDNTAVVGYSMGGYGAVITAGGGVSPFLVDAGLTPFDTLAIHQQGTAAHEALFDPRIKTAVAIGPFGEQFGFWGEAGLAEIQIPMMIIGGSNDETSIYETGIRAIWEGAKNVNRALLTFDGGSHNVVAPIPAPAESFYFNDDLGFNVSEHYTDPVWDTVFSNNVGQHFVTAWLDQYLKGNLDSATYLDLIAKGSDGVFAQNPDGTFAADHTYWKGFKDGTADGLRFEVLAAIPLPASVWLMGMALGGLAVMGRRRRAV